MMKFVSLLAAFVLFATPAAAQDVAGFYKGKTVRIIVGFSAGGGYDHYARVLSRHIGRHIPGQPNVIVQNMPGAASLNSVRYVATAAPTDGTVINAFNPGLITQSVTVPQKIGANFLDFAWLGSVTEDFRVCHTWNGTGIKDWPDLLKRQQVNFGVTGVGTASYIDSKMLSDLFGVHVRQVTGYPGSTEKRIAIERGELDGDCIGWTSVPEQWVREKKVTVHLRFSRTLVADMPATSLVARDVLTDRSQAADLGFAHGIVRGGAALHRSEGGAGGSLRGAARRVRGDVEGPGVRRRDQQAAADDRADDGGSDRGLLEGALQDARRRGRGDAEDFR